jgi:hypothetical protein
MGNFTLRPVSMTGLHEVVGEQSRRYRRVQILIAAIIAITLLFLLLTLTTAQDCPTWEMGTTVSVYPGDFLDGRAGVVFQPGWWADGTPIYVVQILNRNGSVYGYIGATGCDLRTAP